MSRAELFWLLLITGLMVITAAREIHGRRFAMGATLLMVPVAGWIAMWMGE